MLSQEKTGNVNLPWLEKAFAGLQKDVEKRISSLDVVRRKVHAVSLIRGAFKGTPGKS